MARSWDKLSSYAKSNAYLKMTGSPDYSEEDEPHARRMWETRNGLAEIRKAQYKLYLQSDEWAERRLRILRRDNYTCRICSSTTNLHVHHLTYDRKYNESDYDLITICKDCHEIVHELGD